MSNNDSLNTVLNTLTYLDVSAANNRLSRMEAQMNREFMQARMEAYSQQQAIKRVAGFRKQFDRIENATGTSDRMRFLQITLLQMDLEAFDDDELPDLQSRDYLLNLEKQVAGFAQTLSQSIGPEGREVVRDILELPSLIDSAKKDYVMIEAQNAAEGFWLGSPFFALIQVLAAVAALTGAALPFIWDSELSQHFDGEVTYALAPLLCLSGAGVLAVLSVLRIQARGKAVKRIRKALDTVGLEANVKLLGVGASKKRVSSNVVRTGKLGADNGPYAFDRTKLSTMLDGIQKLEARLNASRDALHA